jgi:hypothetical protein
VNTRFRLRLAAVITGGALALVPLSGATAAPATLHPLGTFSYILNNIYAGWSVHPPSGLATSAEGQWDVPKVQCDTAIPFSRPWQQSRAAVWVGLWGQDLDPNVSWLPQVGTNSLCENGGTTLLVGKVTYSAVVQMFHGGNSQAVPLADIQAGDHIYASIKYVGTSDKKLKFDYLIQGARGSTFNILYQYTGSLYTDDGVQPKDAAWQGGDIVESQPDDPLLSGRFIGGLAQFPTPIQFYRLNMVNGKGINTYSGNNTLFRWDMYNNSFNKALAVTGKPVNGRDGFGSEFPVTWGAYH